jgi:hypothetical protein
MASKISIALCMSMALLTGCKTTEVQSNSTIEPKWITDTPKSDYLIFGVGSAKTSGDLRQAQLAAQESARLELAKQLSVSISGSTTVKQSATTKSMKFHVDEIINASVPTIQLQGVKIDQEFQKDGVAYALAVFNRTEAIMQTELNIRALDAEMSQFDFQSDTKTALLRKAIKVKKLAAKRNKFNAYLQILQSTRVVPSETVNTQLKNSEGVLNNLSFNVVSDHSKHAKVHDLLSRALTRNGITIKSKGADFDLSFRVEWQEIYKSGTYYSIAESYMVVGEAGEEKAHFNSKVKAAASYQETAKSNAMSKLANKLSAQLAEFIVSGHS